MIITTTTAVDKNVFINKLFVFNDTYTGTNNIPKIIAYFIFDFKFKELKDFRVIIAYILVVIFTYLLLDDTKKILEISKESCENALTKCNFNNTSDICENYPSYPNQSMNIFLDIINTFQQLGVIYSSGNL